VIVRRRGTRHETFTMGKDETSSPVVPPDGAPAQLFRLDRSLSEVHTDSRYQYAMLVFQGDPEAFHDQFFERGVKLTQTMLVNGFGPLPLPLPLSIELSCGHPVHQFKQAIVALTIAAVAVVSAFVVLVKAFAAPGWARKGQPHVQPEFGGGGGGNSNVEREPIRKTG
jgi:hypothetical protein